MSTVLNGRYELETRIGAGGMAVVGALWTVAWGGRWRSASLRDPGC